MKPIHTGSIGRKALLTRRAKASRLKTRITACRAGSGGVRTCTYASTAAANMIAIAATRRRSMRPSRTNSAANVPAMKKPCALQLKRSSSTSAKPIGRSRLRG